MGDDLAARLDALFSSLTGTAKLRILLALRGGEATCAQVAAATGMNRRHLEVEFTRLTQRGLVAWRPGRRPGTPGKAPRVYRLADTLAARLLRLALTLEG